MWHHFLKLDLHPFSSRQLKHLTHYGMDTALSDLQTKVSGFLGDDLVITALMYGLVEESKLVMHYCTNAVSCSIQCNHIVCR